MLSDKAKAALEVWERHLRYTMAERREAAWDVAVAMNRLFPVRTINGMVIRYDDAITPERVVACGGKSWGTYFTFQSPTTTVCIDAERAAAVVDHKGKRSTLYGDLAPATMGEVWHLMERCGIDFGVDKAAQGSSIVGGKTDIPAN